MKFSLLSHKHANHKKKLQKKLTRKINQIDSLSCSISLQPAAYHKIPIFATGICTIATSEYCSK